MPSVWHGIVCVVVAVFIYQSMMPTTVQVVTEVIITGSQTEIFVFLSNLTRVLELQKERKVDLGESMMEDSITIDHYKMIDAIPIFGLFSYQINYDTFLSKFQENYTISSTFNVESGFTHGKTVWTLHDVTNDSGQLTSRLIEHFTATCPWIFSHFTQAVAAKEHYEILSSVKERIEAGANM
ncbi:uncharacterized protein [Antedon mediterranea]|uniref:uncharacterized protein n=1 Tax=Antedon mediterranea TaxID=105859 RepID=UPI003AF7B771